MVGSQLETLLDLGLFILALCQNVLAGDFNLVNNKLFGNLHVKKRPTNNILHYICLHLNITE